MIDPLAKIDSRARLGRNVSVGPWTYIGPDVEIGDDCVIHSHVVLKGPTRIGRDNEIFQFATLGEATPDLKYRGEPTQLVIGDHNRIREGVTIHRGTVQDRGETRIGSHNLIMAYVHIGHDCVIGDHVILVNNASLAGHVVVDDWAFLSGYTLAHQWVNVGAHAFVGAAAYLNQDVPAYVMVAGHPARPRTINKVGLERRGFTAEQIKVVQDAYRTLFRRSLKLEEALAELEADVCHRELLAPLIASIRRSKRGILR
ncbi:MAG: acyl-ACP--UDP-N-acetylglucosamine O-acyltransferase [Pseudomonadales bacterium]|nr:acyl-ACP--UDP-N-acetylglucosamine O-acyltransferase [Pseudomonadales bacterium]